MIDFFQNVCFKKSPLGTLPICQMVWIMDLEPDQDWHSVGPDLGPNCYR